MNFCEFPVYIQTLEDSQVVLDKLAFHRDSSKEAGSRLPRIFAGQTETYETLHKLLEEIELLLKVWKNRVNHPLTAHLERKMEEREHEDELDLPGVRYFFFLNHPIYLCTNIFFSYRITMGW